MKPLPNTNEKSGHAGATASRSDESFNFDDLSAQDMRAPGGEPEATATTTTTPQEESRESREAKARPAPAARSPSPSALSTASSASPLIRSNSSSSSSSSSTTAGTQLGGKHSTGWRAPSQAGGQRRAHHLAPTSIAVAQLQQQQQRQQLAMQQEKSNSSPKMSKFSSGNKLAQMAHSRHQVSGELPAKKPKKPEPKQSEQVGRHEGKSLGYNFGKMMAHRASRFNEFWSVNKMRYMNLACLLMTLVCLFTILLFSKSGGSGRSLASLDSPANQAQRLQQQHRHRFMAATNEEQPTTTAAATTMGGEDEQEHPLESIDSIDRQPFVRSPGRKHALTMASSGDDEQAADSTGGGSGGNSADGFNLFDETDSQATAPNGKHSLDDLLQDARRQLKRQQANERETEESTTAAAATSGASTTQATSAEQLLANGGDDKAPSRKLAPIVDPLLSQVLGDLDGFGLFKSIKLQLFEQLNRATLAGGNATSGPSELFAEGKPIIRRGKNGATIIMSFGGSLLGDKQPDVNGSAPTSANETTAVPPSLGSALERLLLPPPLAMMLGASAKLPAQGFARITINSAEPTILRSSPLEGPLPLFARSPFTPFEHQAAQSPARMFASGDSPLPGGAPSTGGGGFMSMILRASSDIARQMDKQLSKSASNQTQLAATTNSTQQQNELKPEASQQQVKVAPGSLGENEDAEVETFDVSRMIGAAGSGPRGLPMSPFHSLYSGGRALRPPPLIMIGSSSGGSDSSPFAMLSPPVPSGSMFMMGDHPRPAFSLSSVLSDVMSTMAREARGLASRRGDPELDTPTRARLDEEEEQSSSWDEKRASGRLRPRHRSFDSDGDSDRDDTPLFKRSSSHSSSSSLLEHLLNGGSGGGGLHVARRTFGTIRQTFRSPDGVTVERTIEMPPHGLRQFEVQAVPAGVRSQSISSRMDESASAGQDRAPAFARMMRELAPPSVPFHPATLFSRNGPSPLFGRLSSELESADATAEDEGTTAASSAQNPAGIDRSDAQAGASEQEESPQESVEMPARGWSAASDNHFARVHIAGPRFADQLPQHFSVPASAPASPHSTNERSQASGSGPAESRQKSNENPHSSPSSPLFGFPALKPTLKSPGQVVAGVTEPLAAASSQRQPRAFVYHSNHEIAARQQQQQQPGQARARYASNQVAPASASMVMGRRLDEFVDQRR